MNKLEHIYHQEQFGENWFSYPNLYSDIVKQFPSGSKFVEVGSWMGRSTSYMAVEIANSKKDIEFYCVDTWEGGPDHQGREELSELYNIFLNNMKPVEEYYIPLRNTSLNASKKFEDNSLDFVFIDASHEYEDVKNDILAWLPKVKPGGILAGHDYYPEGCYDWFPGVKRAVNECLNNFEVLESELCFIYKKPINFCSMKVLFFGRNSKDEIWEHDFILNEVLDKNEFKKTYFLSLDEVRNSSDTFDVFVYSARDPNIYSWGYTPTYDEVLECVLKTKPKVVIQLSDEFYEENLQEHNNIANYCELFLRQYNHSNYQYTKNTLHIPLGHYNGYNVSREKIKPIKERVYNWSFVGAKKSDRIPMVDTFSTISDNYCLLHEGSITIPAEELIEIYINSIFVPCSRGWELLNTMRSYEVSMSGAIPILVGTQEEIENTFKYEENPPWLFFDSWENAVKKCQELLNDIDTLQQIQTNILSWWDMRMEKIQKRTSISLTEKFEKNKDMKVLFFGRNSKDEVWEHDYIMNDILPKDYIKKTYFLSLDEVRNSSDTFDVFVYSARDPNIYSWGYTPTYDEVLECVLKTKPKVVIQLSDEYKDEDLEHYNQLSDYCELFLRQYNHQEYRNSKFKTNVPNDNIVYIPLGYCNGTPVDKIKTVPSSEKKYNWSFIGKIKDWEFCFFDNVKQKWVSVGDRTEMTETFKSNIQDFFFAQEGIDKDELIRIYSNSIFVPCGRGNSSLDCFRLYEASMCGAISVVVGSFGEIENTFRYEENPPWVFAESWDEAAKICKDLLNNKDHLQEVQNNLLSWWNNRIDKIQDRVNNVFSNIEYNDYSYKLKNFPPINFISVDKSEDRRNLLYEKFANYNLTNIRPHIFEVYNDEDHHYIGESFRELNGIGRGPTTSHLKAIKDWYFDTEEEYAFFCEDDISFDTVKYWNFTWEEFFNSLPEDWGCVQLCWIREGDMFVFSTGGLKLRHRCWCDWSACAYLIKRSHAKKLISNYYRNGSFNLDFVGNDSHVRPKWAKDPVAETIIFSPLGNPKNIDVNVSVVYGFPLFVEDVYNCESELLKYDCGNVLFPQRDCHEISHNTILNWWETKGKNLKVKDIIDI